MEFYIEEGKILKQTILSVLGYNSGLLHQDNYYNSAPNAWTLLQQNPSVCGTIRTSKVLPISINAQGENLKNGATTFKQKGDVLAIWRDKREVRMISTTHGSEQAPTGKQEKRFPSPCV
jgi:hypothetical protein